MSVRSRVSTGGAADRLAERPARVLPVLLDVLGAADPVELERLEVGGLGQQQVGVPVGLVLRVGEGGDEGEALELALDALRVPVRDGRVRAVDDPDVGQRRRRPVLGRLVHEEPRQVRGPSAGDHGELSASGTSVRYALRMCGAPCHVPFAVGLIGCSMKPSRPGLHRVETVLGRAVEPHGGPENAAGHLERADQRGQHRPRPAALVAAPAVRHRLAQQHGDRPVRILHAVDGDRGADRRVGAGSHTPAGGSSRRGHRRSPRPTPACTTGHGPSDGRRRASRARSPSGARRRRRSRRRRRCTRRRARAPGSRGRRRARDAPCPHPRPPASRRGVTEEVAARADEVGRAGHALEERHVARGAPVLLARGSRGASRRARRRRSWVGWAPIRRRRPR